MKLFLKLIVFEEELCVVGVCIDGVIVGELCFCGLCENVEIIDVEIFLCDCVMWI